MKKIIGTIIIFFMAAICGVSAWADNEPATLIIQAPQGQVKVGDAVSVSLNISSVKPIGRVTATVEYDASALTFVSGDGATGGNGVINIQQLNGLGESAAIALNFKATAEGNAVVSVSSCAVYDAFEEPYQLKGSATTIAISNTEQTDAPQSQQTTTSIETDRNGVPTQGVLVDLTADNATLKPPFMYSIHEYSITVPYEVDRVEIEGKTASTQDHIWYTGNAECAVGQNVRTITVTDINGNKTVYTIYITRLDKDEEKTSVTTQSSEQTSAMTQSDRKNQTLKNDSKDIKQTLIPALYIVLIVLIVALVIVIIWIKNRSSRASSSDRSEKQNERQRSRIKISGNKNSKKKK